jgi:hypothetical protein
MRPGVVILLGGAFVSVVVRGRLGAGLGLTTALVVGVASLEQTLVDVGGDRGPYVATVRLVQISALVVAMVAASRELSQGLPRRVRRVRGRGKGAKRDWARGAQIVGLLGLSAIGAELLAAYGDSTGDPGGVAFALVFFAALYGAPALLARDLVRRRGWGWPSLLLLFAALGVTQACLIDQSLFSTDYQGYDGWEEDREATLIPALGLSAFNAYNFILGHVIFSFGAPVAVAEAWRPELAHEPWLGRAGTLLSVVAYAGAAALILLDPESRSGSVPQLVISAAVVGALVVGAGATGTRGGRRSSAAATAGDARHSLPVWAALVIALIAALVTSMVEANWLGFTIGAAMTCAVGCALLVVARHRGWSPRHIAAVALAFLLVRGLLAFTYFPLIGEVQAVPKYVHNIVMMLVVALTGWVAVRPRPDQAPRPSELVGLPESRPRH